MFNFLLVMLLWTVQNKKKIMFVIALEFIDLCSKIKQYFDWYVTKFLCWMFESKMWSKFSPCLRSLGQSVIEISQDLIWKKKIMHLSNQHENPSINHFNTVNFSQNYSFLHFIWLISDINSPSQIFTQRALALFNPVFVYGNVAIRTFHLIFSIYAYE